MIDEKRGQTSAGGSVTSELRALSDLQARSAIAALLGQTFGGNRKLYDVLGYNKTPQFTDYLARYKRGVARRLVRAAPQATWRKRPTIVETLADSDKGDADRDRTPFEKAWDDLEQRLNIFSVLERADTLSGIGRFAVILIGTTDSADLAQPASPGTVEYLSIFHEGFATVDKLVSEPADPRFGLPRLYTLDTARGNSSSSSNSSTSKRVDHSRVIHVAEDRSDDDVYGTPRLEPVYNYLDDLDKVVGGSAEMFWQGAYGGLIAKVMKDFQLEPDAAKKLNTDLFDFMHGLKRSFISEGFEVDRLQSQTPDPTGNFDTILSLISGTTGIPKRILIGSERGELASTQDETAWNERVSERQANYAEPAILRPMIDRFIELGGLEKPSIGYEVEWDDLLALSEKDKAEVVLKRSQALAAYSGAGQSGALIMPPEEYREEVLGLDPVPKGGFEEEPPIDETDPAVQDQFTKSKNRAAA